MNAQDTKLNEQFKREPWGALLVRYGYEPVNTESSARQVARLAAAEIETLNAEIKKLKWKIRKANRK